MDGIDLDKLRDLSKSLLGGKYQAEIGIAIAEASGSIWGSGLQESLGKRAPAKGKISIEIDRLQEANLLMSDKSSPYDRRKLLKPVDERGAYWEFCLELRRTAE